MVLVVLIDYKMPFSVFATGHADRCTGHNQQSLSGRPTQAPATILAMGLYRHPLPHRCQVLQVNLGGGNAGRQGVVQTADDPAPGVDNDRVPVALPLLIVPPCLRRRYYIALRLNSARPEQELPMRFACMPSHSALPQHT